MGSCQQAMQVIGAGLPRTGTLSTKAALDQLLGPCYHGSVPVVERQDHAPFWLDAMDKGRLDPARTRHELSGYMCGVDFPVAGWYKELMEIYPEAKVILTVRDPKKWYKSVCFILQNTITLCYNRPYSWFLCLIGSSSVCKYEQKISGGIEPGKGELPPGIPGRMNKALRKGEQAAVDFFKSHRDEVCSQVPSSQLLVFDVREGWEPLCKFLDVPMPDAPFPNINKTAEVGFLFKIIKIVVWLAILGVSVLLLCTVLYCPDYTLLPPALGVVGVFLWGVGKIMMTACRR